MSYIIGLLTVVLVVDCLVLILLVLIQLPKKEAGAGLAFGGSATDALFGAGTGNVLTKITKYATAIFFILAMLIAILQNNYYHRSTTELQRLMSQQPGPIAPGALPGPATTTSPGTAAPLEATGKQATTPSATTGQPAAPTPATPEPAPAQQK